MKLDELLDVKGARVQVIIQEATRIGQFNSALYYSFKELENMTVADIEAERTRRTDAWVTFVEDQSSKPPVEPTKAELEAILDQERIRKMEAQNRIEELEAKIAVKVG